MTTYGLLAQRKCGELPSAISFKSLKLLLHGQDVGNPKCQKHYCTTEITKKKMESHPMDHHSSSKRIKIKTKSSKDDITCRFTLGGCCSLTRNEPRLWFVSNSIHKKKRPKNLKGDGVENKIGASQAWFQ